MTNYFPHLTDLERQHLSDEQCREFDNFVRSNEYRSNQRFREHNSTFTMAALDGLSGAVGLESDYCSRPDIFAEVDQYGFDRDEKLVVLMLIHGYSRAEIIERSGMKRWVYDRLVASVRAKVKQELGYI